MNSIKKGIIFLRQQLKKESNSQIIKFCIVGVLNTAVDYIVYAICVKFFGIHYAISQVIGPIFGIINSFILNRLWTFKSDNKGKKTLQELVQFVIVNVVSIGISVIALGILVDGNGMEELIAKVIIIPVTQIVNFLGYKLWVFKKT